MSQSTTSVTSTTLSEWDVQKLIESGQLKSKLEQITKNIELNADKQQFKLQFCQDLRNYINIVLNLYVQKHKEVDLDMVIKLLSGCKEKIQGHSEFKLANDHSLSDEFEILLTEILNLKSIELSYLPKQQQDQQQRLLAQLIQSLSQQSIISEKNLILYLEEFSIASSGLMPQAAHKSRFTRAITQIMFEQQKFNLLREENEGFAKLIVELNQSNINTDNIQNVITNIEALIGFFNLDPNRVLDIILDSLENNIWNSEGYLILIKKYSSQNIAQVLGFKFQNYLDLIKQAKSEKNPNIDQIVDKSLFTMTAMLLKHNIISLEQIWPHLGDFKETADELDEVENLMNRQNKLMQFHYKQLFETVMNKEAFEQSTKQIKAEEEEVDSIRREMNFNFRMMLLEALVTINQWALVDEIIGRLYDYKLDLTISKSLLQSMFVAMNWFIEPLYQVHSKSKKLPLLAIHKSHEYYYDKKNPHGQLRQASDADIFFEDIDIILKHVNVYLAYDKMLFQKLAIVIKHNMSFNFKKSIQIAGEVLYPALALVECNNELAVHVWDILSQADTFTRYDYYTQMLTQTYLQNTALTTVMIETQEQIKNWQRRLSIDTVRQNSRQLAKLASGNAVVVFNTVLQQAKNYKNMIEAQVQSLQYCSPLALDIVAYSFLRLISDCNEDRLDKEANISDWLQNLAEFAALFFKKYCQVDMVGILTYLLNRIKIDNEYNEMIILKEVIAKMYGWSQFNINEMTAQQLQSLAGGFYLRLELMSQTTQFKRTQKSSDALGNLFWEKTNEKPLSLAFRLMANLVNLTKHTSTSVQTQQMALVSTLYDRSQFTFIQFVDTLNYLQDARNKYQYLLPQQVERVLTVNYRLPPQYVFYIMRGSLKPIYELTDEEFNQQVHIFKSVLEMHLDQRIELAKDEESEYWDEKGFLLHKREDVWKCLNPKLYTIFWYLQLQHLVVPEEVYIEQNKKLTNTIEQLKSQGSNQRKNNKEIDRLKGLKGNLQTELQTQLINKTQVTEFLERKLGECFENLGDDQLINVATVFIQYCLHPRIMFSPSDSLYSINFFKTLRQHRVPNFNILHTLGQILKSIVPCIHCCTFSESDSLGIFFLELFSLINHWSQPENWDKECTGYSGFAKMIGTSQQIKLSEFQSIVEAIHKRFGQNLIVCFQNAKQSMKTQCGLKILNKLLPQFPNQYLIAKVLNKYLQQLIEQKNEIDQGLWTLAFSCNQNLIKKMMGMEKPPNCQNDFIDNKPQLKEKEPNKESKKRDENNKEKQTKERGGDKGGDKDYTKDKKDQEDGGAGESKHKTKEKEKEEKKVTNNIRNIIQKDDNNITGYSRADTQTSVNRDNRERGDRGDRGERGERGGDRNNDKDYINKHDKDKKDNYYKRKDSKSPTPSGKRNFRRNSTGKDLDDKKYRDVKRIERDDDISNRIQRTNTTQGGGSYRKN